MKLNVDKELARLRAMSTAQLKQKYQEVWQETPRSPNKPFLIKRIIWRMQALQEGSLSERALARARELANEADLRITAPRMKSPVNGGETVTLPLRSERLPMEDTVLTRKYKGKLLQVTVLADGFEFEGEHYKSLIAVARRITGTNWNGYLFFGLSKDPRSNHSGSTR